jgi:hypothetical protein
MQEPDEITTHADRTQFQHSVEQQNFIRYTATLLVENVKPGVGCHIQTFPNGSLFESVDQLQQVEPLQVEMPVQEEVETNQEYPWSFKDLDESESENQLSQQKDEAAKSPDSGDVEKQQHSKATSGDESDVLACEKMLHLNKPVERTGRQVYLFSGGQPCVAKVYLYRPILLTGGVTKVGLFVLNGSTRHIAAFRYKLLRVTQIGMADEAPTQMVEEVLSEDFEPTDAVNNEIVEAVKPMESGNLEFDIRIPSSTEGSLLHSDLIRVTHALVVEMTGKGVAGATLSVSVPVCVIEDQ